MDVQDALELLGPTFTHPAVRTYAVARLKQALDEVCKYKYNTSLPPCIIALLLIDVYAFLFIGSAIISFATCASFEVRQC